MYKNIILKNIDDLTSVPYPPLDINFFSKIVHHELSKLFFKNGISNDSVYISDEFILRLINSYCFAYNSLLSTKKVNINGLSNWEENFVLGDKRIIHFAVYKKKSIQLVKHLLSDPLNSDLWFGFHEPTKSRKNIGEYISSLDYDILFRFAQLVGAVNVENPENPRTKYPDPDLLIQLLQASFKKNLFFPTPYPNMFGLSTSYGIVGHRALWGLYSATLLSKYKATNVLEIGAGLGWTAYFSSFFDVKNYTIIDIPITSLASAHFLASTKGEKNIILFSEDDSNMSLHEESICKYFFYPSTEFISDAKYDLVLNCDSLTEMDLESMFSYIDYIKKCTKVFISINHESNKNSVAKLLKNDNHIYEYQRNFFPLRKGYLEEVFIFK